MPEYMTKCEPVDKKPYIVYTDEKGILYSGDPDSDIPGGGGSVDFGYLCSIMAYYDNNGVNTELEATCGASINEKAAFSAYITNPPSSNVSIASGIDIMLIIEDENVASDDWTITAKTYNNQQPSAFTDFTATFDDDESVWIISCTVPDAGEYGALNFFFASNK